MNCIFIHDFKYKEYMGTIYGEGQFSYEHLWKKKYLSVFEHLSVVARGSKVYRKNEVASLSLLSGPRVNFVSTDSLSSIKRLLNTSNVRNIIEKEVVNADIAMVRLPSIQGIIACSVLQKMNKPYVVEVVGSAFDSLWYHDRFKGRIMAPILHVLNKKAIRKAPNAIYVTDTYLQEKYPNQNNTVACSDVIIEDLNEGILEDRIKKINSRSKNKNIKIGLVGSYDVMYKGHDIAIQALSDIKDKHKVELHFLGSGSKEQWEVMAHKYNVKKLLYFDKPINSGVEMNNWLDEIDILFTPSKTEGMPRVVLESMARAGVIVASSVGDIPYVLNNDNVFDKYDWKGFSSRIIELINNPQEMQLVAKENFKKAHSYHLDKLSKKRNAFLKDIVNKDRK
jgi:glycosyltransferase involved in cell wall biosynthesis